MVDVIQCLMNCGWSLEQATGALSDMDLPPWGDAVGKWRSNLLKDWCSVKDLDYRSLEGQLAFLDYELNNTMHKLGTKLRAATTVEEARAAIKPYAENLKTEGKLT